VPRLPSTGKTLLGLHFALAGAAAGERALYLSFRETEPELRRLTAPFALGPRLATALAPGGGLTLLRTAPVELDPDAAADALLRALDATGADRLVIDSSTELEAAAAADDDPGRLRNYLAALAEVLRERGTSTLLLKETSRLVTPELEAPADALAILAENVLLLRQLPLRGRLRRVLSALKVAYSAHDVRVREFEITPPEGVRVLGPLESDGEVLAEVADDDRREGGRTGQGRGRTPPEPR
jgi:circadian clock protein KaiC